MSRPAPLSDNVAAALCYLAMPLSALALLLLEPFRSRPFVRFHALQALYVSGAMVALAITLPMFLGVLFFLPIVGRILGGLLFLGLWSGFLALWLWLMWQALQGKRFKLPLIGNFAARQAA